MSFFTNDYFLFLIINVAKLAIITKNNTLIIDFVPVLVPFPGFTFDTLSSRTEGAEVEHTTAGSNT